MSARLPKRPRVVVTVKGGTVQSVTADRPIDLLVLDFDTEGREANAAINGQPVNAHDGVTVDRARCADIFRSLQRD